MRIAYFITAYKKPDQLKRLIERLNSPNVVFFIHVNKIYGSRFDRLDFSNISASVYFTKNINVYWGGFSQVELVINGLKEIIDFPEKFDYIMLISEQQYPIKSNEQINEFLTANYGGEFISSFRLPSDKWEIEDYGLDRIHYYYYIDDGLSEGRSLYEVLNPKGEKKDCLPGIEPYGGSAWWCLTRESVLYILGYIQVRQDFVEFYKYSKIPCEMFFQSLLMNSPFAGQSANNNLLYEDWSEKGSSPKILTTDDYERIAASDKLFARKFDDEVDIGILDKIDHLLL